MEVPILFVYPRIVPGGDLVESVFERLSKETIEFHEIITEDIRIRCESFLVSFVDVSDDPFLILRTEIERVKWEAEIFRDLSSFLYVDESRAIRSIGDVVDHESARYLMPSFPEKIGNDSGIYSARESYEDFGHYSFIF